MNVFVLVRRLLQSGCCVVLAHNFFLGTNDYTFVMHMVHDLLVVDMTVHCLSCSCYLLLSMNRPYTRHYLNLVIRICVENRVKLLW